VVATAGAAKGGKDARVFLEAGHRILLPRIMTRIYLEMIVPAIIIITH
jgi:hypothetical protein